MEFLKKLGGGAGEAPKATEGSQKAGGELERVECIRAVNRDWVELGCSKDASTVPCLNVLEAMARLSLPAATSAQETASAKVELGAARVASQPPKLVSQRDADAQAACTKRCGVLGGVLGAALSSAALTSNVVADLGVADEQRDVVAQAGAAAASVVAVAVCARFCEPGRKQKTFEAPGVGYQVKGEYTHTLQTKKEVDDFIAAHKPRK